MYTIGNPGGDPIWDSTRRQYWVRSYGGKFLADFEAGYAGGKADLEGNVTTYFDTIDSVEVGLRGTVWEARLDGYKEATLKERGPTKYGF